VEVTLRVRGGKDVKATVSSARLKVTAHGKKRLVVALKYEGESDYRYLVATDMTWRTRDMIQAYTLRWLVEIYQTYCLHKSVYKKLMHFITGLIYPDTLSHALFA
jgi:hypothetical protein